MKALLVATAALLALTLPAQAVPIENKVRESHTCKELVYTSTQDYTFEVAGWLSWRGECITYPVNTNPDPYTSPQYRHYMDTGLKLDLKADLKNARVNGIRALNEATTHIQGLEALQLLSAAERGIETGGPFSVWTFMRLTGHKPE